MGIEIFIPDISSPQYADPVVNGEGLVVHAPRHVPEAGQKLYTPSAFPAERVEETHFDMGMGIEGHGTPVAPAQVHVVNQQPHADAPIRGLQQLVDEQDTRHVVVQQIVLGINAALGQLGQHRPRDEGIQPVSQQAETRLTRMLQRQARDRPPEDGVVGVRIGTGNRSFDARWQSRTRGCKQRQQHHEQTCTARGKATGSKTVGCGAIEPWRCDRPVLRLARMGEHKMRPLERTDR